MLSSRLSAPYLYGKNLWFQFFFSLLLEARVKQSKISSGIVEQKQQSRV